MFTAWQMKHRQQFFMPLLAPGALVFDVGANMGEFTAAFLSAGAGKVVAVEPQSDHCLHLATAFASSIIEKKVVIKPYAASSKPGHMRLQVSNDPQHTMSTLSSTFVEVGRKNGYNWDVAAAVDVPVTTLAALIADFGRPDFIKIDVEGHELEVLQGLDAAVNLVSFEYNTDPQLLQAASLCVDRMCELGDYEFNFQAEAQDMTALQFDRWVSADLIKFTLHNDIARQRRYGDVYCRLRASGAA